MTSTEHGAPAARSEPRPFVGRERELDELEGLLERAIRGNGELVLLVGEAGIGKSAVAERLGARAVEHGAAVLRGRCFEEGGAPAYWPWVQIVRAFVAETEPSALAAVMGTSAVQVAQLLPEARERLVELHGHAPPLLDDPEQARFSFFDAIATFLRTAARSRPALLLLEDLHAADPCSLLLLRFLARELATMRILLLGTYRGAEARRAAAARPLLSSVAAEGRTIVLAGLSEAEVAALMSVLVGSPAPASFVSSLHRLTGGNPLFVEEVIRLLVCQGSLDDPVRLLADARMLPERVRDVMRRRCDLLSEHSREVLRIAAVIGEEVPLALVELVVGRARETVQAHLSEAVEAGFLVHEPVALGRYRFSHPLMRESLYAELGDADAAAIHGRVGCALENLAGVEADRRLVELEHHFSRAVRAGGDVEKAIHYATRAGDRAAELLAYEEAASQYDRALQALALDPGEDERRRLELIAALAEARVCAGDRDGARESFRAAAHLARRLGETGALARIALAHSGARLGVPEFGSADPELVSLLEESLAGLGSPDSALRARVLGRLATELYFTGPPERRRALADEALAVARRVGDRRALAAALMAKHVADWRPENLDERLVLADEMLELAEGAGDLELELASRYWRICNRLEAGEMHRVDVEFGAFARLAEQSRQPFWAWIAGLHRTMRALLEGRLADAERLAGMALELGRRPQEEKALLAFGVQMGMIRREQGRPEEWEAMARAAIERYPGMPAFRWALAAVLCESGRDDAARAELERLSAASLAELPRDALFLTIATLAAEVCAHLGDDDRARDLYALLAPHAPRNAAAIWGALCLGSVERCLGLLTGAMGRTDEAANHFEAAISFDARLGSPPLVARTRIDYARSLLARGRPGDRVRATQLLEAALQIGQRLELSATSERASRLLAEMGHARGADIREAAAQADAGPPPVGKGASSAGDASAGPRSSANFFRREGDYWTVCFDGQVCRIRDSKGARYLARLLSHPGHEFHALELLAEMAPVELAPVRTRAWPPGRAELEGEALSSREPADAGDILDAKAKESYRRRLRDLEDDLEEARANGDLERASSAEEELEFLGHELARALGLSGRERKSSSPSERARLNVSRALRTTVEKLARFDPALGEHLAHSIRTGRLCSYSHDPALEIAWET